MSQVVIVGGTGYAGGHIAAEAVSRGHQVTSWSRRRPSAPLPGVHYEVGSIRDEVTMKSVLAYADDVVIAIHGADVDGVPLADLVPTLAAGAIEYDVRLSFVGGAGSSYAIEDGPRLVDTPDFHEEWKAEALAHADVLAALRSAPAELRWFYVSPAALFGSWAPGETTGAYRTGGDVLVSKADGSSEISGTDFALAYVDEIEQVAHPNQRFTVGH